MSKIYLNTRQELTKIINEHNYKTAVEIGVRYGNYSYYLLKNSNLGKIYCIDVWEKFGDMGFEELGGIDVRISCENLLKEYISSGRCELIQKYSVLASKDFEDNFFDFVYIDASHSYERVKEDISVWWNKTKKGGCFAGHDYCNDAWPGVYRAVNEFVEENKLELLLTDCKGTDYYGHDDNRKSWFIIK